MSPAARAAAAAKAEAEKKAQAQAAEAAKAAKATAPKKAVRNFKDTPVPEFRSGRTSPAAQARAFLAASVGASALSAVQQQNDIALTSDEAKVVVQLEADRRALKDIKATDRKIEAKRLMLPAYKGWINGVIAAGKAEPGPLDQVFTQLLAWTIDIGDYLAALPMLEHAMTFGLAMPAHFNRDPITFAIDQISDAAINHYELGLNADAFDAAVLPMLQDLVKDHDVDLHDEVEAKLFKALGRAILADANPDDAEDLRNRQQSALDAYMAAIAKHDRVGVKKDIEKLQRELKKSDPAPGNPEA